MRNAIRRATAQCTKCRQVDPHPQVSDKKAMPVPPRALHTIGMDVVGPFHQSSSGNKYLLTLIDHLTGWGEAYPLKSKSNEEVWKAFNKFIANYGIPSVIISDNGGEFLATKFRKWLAELGIDHRTTTPYHPQTNGKTERFNGILQKLLLKHTEGNGTVWEDFLNDALYAYRCTAGADGQSPFQKLYGQRPRQPRASPKGLTPGQRFSNIRKTTEQAQNFLKLQGQKYVKQDKKNKRKPYQYHEGDFVSLRVHNATKGFSRWEPGFQVIKIFGNVLYVQRGKKTHRVNVQNARPIEKALPYDLIEARKVKPVTSTPEPGKPEARPRTNERYNLRPGLHVAPAATVSASELNPQAPEFVPKRDTLSRLLCLVII